MWKYFALIAFEIILVAVIGFFTNLAAVELKINSAYVWIALIFFLLLLIATTWFRVSLDLGKDWMKWRITIPEKITISISLGSLRSNLRFLLALIINGALFGWLVANASIFAVRVVPELGYTVTYNYVNFGVLPGAYSFEIIGIIAIGFASMIVSKRLSLIIGFLFCAVSSFFFSITHLNALPFEYATWTILGNLLASLLMIAIGLFLYPVLHMIVQQIKEFWGVSLKK